MQKTDKELAVELACATLNAISHKASPKPISGEDIRNILNDCYDAIQSLEKE